MRTKRNRSETELRKALFARLREWGNAVQIHAGPYPVHASTLQTSFGEWLEAQEPGMLIRSLELMTPFQFRRAFHKEFNKVKIKTRTRGKDMTFYYLRYGVVTKDAPWEFVRTTCEKCQLYAWEWRQAPQKSKEELAEEMRKAEAEAAAAAAPTPKAAYIDQLIERRQKSGG